MNEESKRSPSSLQPRREFLKWMGISSAVAITHPLTGQIKLRPVDVSNVDNVKVSPQLVHPRYTSIKLLRPEDLLSLELRFHGFVRQGKGLKRVEDKAHLVVIFQPQSISEEAWIEDENGLQTPAVPGKMFIGGESRLVFEIPASLTELPIDASTLLTWNEFGLSVSPRARSAKPKKSVNPGQLNDKLKAFEGKITTSDFRLHPNTSQNLSKTELEIVKSVVATEQPSLGRREMIRAVPGIKTNIVNEIVRAPEELETAIEVPNRLYLSPTRQAAWKHQISLKAEPGILKQTNRLFELWHTRLASRTSKGIDESELTSAQRILRAIWADDANPDYKAPVTKKELDKLLGITSMNNRDRHQIVHESSNFQIPNFTPPPIEAYQLFLTTLGAWLNSSFVVEREQLKAAQILGETEQSNAFDLLKWRHIETLGREHYVELVYAGNILPFGHEAVLIKITERKPHKKTGTAANFQRKLVVITQPVKYYDYIDSNGKFMNFCFKRIELVTTISPLLDIPLTALASGVTGVEQFVIKSLGTEVPFAIKATDQDGKTIAFSMPLAFASGDALSNASNIQAFIDAYNSENPSRPINNRAPTSGQSFTLAPSSINATSTTYSSYEIVFGMQRYQSADELQGFLPVLKEASIVEPSYLRLTGKTLITPVSLIDERNAGSVFAKFNLPNAINFSGNADKTGGLAAPNFQLTGLSKATGAFGGDLQKFKEAKASAIDYFNVSNLPEPTLFGVFKLSELLNFGLPNSSAYDLTKPLAQRNPKIPNLQNQEDADYWITSYVLKPDLNEISTDFVAFKRRANEAEFAIVTQVKTPKLPGSKPSFSTDAYLRGFDVGIVKVGSEYLISIHFSEVRFRIEAGKKADVSVKMQSDSMDFGGPLSFINAFTSLVDPQGFYDPPYVDVSLVGVKCGYSLDLPNLQLGAFTLSHLGLGAEVNLPFSGAPMTVGFRFCERHQPFTLTVSCLGGGGFFGFELDLAGLRQIEAALEFGAAVSMNFGVASGAVSVMAGIYFKMEFINAQNSTQLTGYVRINGAVSVLGLITASIELYMALNYMIDSGKAIGEASLKIKVEVAFFSKTVTIKAQRTFAGSGNDPNCQMAITQDDWLDYCSAFAA